MGEIVGVGLVSHVPTIMMSKEQRYALNDGKEISLVTGLQDMRREILEPLNPDVVIVIDTHWFTIVEFALPTTMNTYQYIIPLLIYLSISKVMNSGFQ